jgi:hypothetical protein
MKLRNATQKENAKEHDKNDGKRLFSVQFLLTTLAIESYEYSEDIALEATES